MKTIPDSDEAKAADTVTTPATGTPKTPTAAFAPIKRGKRRSSTDSPENQWRYSPLTRRSKNSTRHFRRPVTVRELATQVTELATRVLNGELSGEDLDNARLYSNLVRTTAQLVTSEVQRSRFLRTEPDLTLDSQVFDDEE